MFHVLANRAFSRCFSLSDNPDRDQNRALRRILRGASRTEISKRYGLDGVRSVNEYQKACPVHHYDDLKAYWQRLERGESDVLFHGTPTCFALSSGTTGAQKRIPVNEFLFTSYRNSQNRLLSVYLAEHCNSRLLDSKLLLITGRSRIAETPAGIVCGVMSGISLEKLSPNRKKRAFPTIKTLNIADWHEKMRAMVREITGQKIAGVFGIPSILLAFLKFAKQTMTQEEFQYFSDHLELCFVSGVAFQIYRDAICSTLGKEVHFFNFYAASEAMMGYQVSGTSFFRLLTNKVFYEFLPFTEYQRGRYDTRLLITQLSEGEEYVLLVTNGSGAFSYVIGDVLRCARAGRIPLLELAGRTALTLNVVSEKTTIQAVEKVMGALSKELGESPEEFVVTAKREGARPNYVWVLQECPAWQQTPPGWLENRLDELLCEHSPSYARYVGAQLAPCEVLFLNSGAFQSWLSARGTERGQQKIPRIVPDISEVTRYLSGHV